MRAGAGWGARCLEGLVRSGTEDRVPPCGKPGRDRRQERALARPCRSAILCFGKMKFIAYLVRDFEGTGVSMVTKSCKSIELTYP
ncbi:MAG: hypothetical protein D6722_13140 [Bacteroidetes bacterium]|nr:MAG: hypothetical protein D6722_13140 [Bacteroidota bacterium]